MPKGLQAKGLARRDKILLAAAAIAKGVDVFIVPPHKSVKRRLVALLYPPYQYCVLHLLTSCL